MTSASTNTAATTTYAARHPKYCPRKVPPGTPTTFATVSPLITIATPHPRRLGPRISLAITVDMPKKAPCGSPDRNRVAAIVSNVGATTVSAFATSSAATRITMTRWRGKRATNAAIVGAPITTPRA